MENLVLVLGSGHLATQTMQELAMREYRVIHIGSGTFKEKGDTSIQESSLAYAQNKLMEVGIAEVKAVLVVDKVDQNNIHMLLAVLSLRQDIPVIASFLNERIATHLRKTHKNLEVFNLAVETTPFFVKAIQTEASPAIISNRRKIQPINALKAPADNLITRLVAGFFALLVIGTDFFALSENVSLDKAFYLMITVVTSVNFNDVSLVNQSFFAKNFRTMLLLGSWAYAVISIAFLIDQFMKRRIETVEYGRKRYHLKNHIIVCGLGRMGYCVVRQLLKIGYEVIVLEENSHNHYLDTVRSYGAKVIVGNAALSGNLVNASLGEALALLSLINNDMKNLEIGLIARDLQPDTRLILRIFDKGIADEIKRRLNIHYAFSTSELGARKMVKSLSEKFVMSSTAQNSKQP